MWKIYAAPGILFAGADRVLCHLLMFLAVVSHCMYKMKYGCCKEFLCYSWLVCLLGFWLINAPLVKVFENELTHFTMLDA